MALNLKNHEVERLAREVAAEAGESLTDAVKHALEERLELLRRRKAHAATYARVAGIQAMVRELPVRHVRTPDELLYDAEGLPR